MDAVVQWIAPPRVWSSAKSEDARRPAILRFATDSFMKDFTTVLDNQPERLIEWCVQPETWRGPSAEPASVAMLPPAARRFKALTMGTGALSTRTDLVPAAAPRPDPKALLKLYQPAHQRFYLLSACLVCRLPGLPDRTIEVGAEEAVSFVVRRLRPKTSAPLTSSFVFDSTSCDEYALVDDTWVKVEADEDLAIGEEQLSLFPYSYQERDGRKRRLLSALIPVSNREKYAGAIAAPLAIPSPLLLDRLTRAIDPRKALLMRDVTDVWRSLITRFDNVQILSDKTNNAPLGDGKQDDKTDSVDRLKFQGKDDADYLSWLILLDLDRFLKEHVPNVWNAMNVSSPAGLNAAEKTVYDRLQSKLNPSEGITLTLAQALIAVRPYLNSIEGTTFEYSTLSNKVPKAPAWNPLPPSQPPAGTWPNFRFPLQNLRQLVDGKNGSPTLDDQINAALPVIHHSPAPALPLAARLSKSDMREPLWLVVRCIFERPNCGPLKPIVVSDASQPFQMASFFDSDAPARPIRIPMPMDITPAGLRKFDKNTAFMLSDALCAQVTRARELSFGDLVLSVLPWPFYKPLPKAGGGTCNDGLDIGMICSLSIPIITICALILLIIIVLLFDLIFHWIPFFITCFPIPNFSAKGETS